MTKLSERLNTPISTAELERRWKAVRAAMEAEKVDVLLIQNNNDYMGGYVKYFTDLSATNGYPNTVVFPRDDMMTLVGQGPFGGTQELTAGGGDGVRRGVKQVLTTPSFASAHFTKDYDPELAVCALKPYASATIGLVCTYQMSFAMADYVKRALPNARFVDATELVDRIKSLKSPEEQELVVRAALMQDGAMKAAFDAIRPGMRDMEVSAAAQYYSRCHGSENGIYLCASGPIGTPIKFSQIHLQNRVIQEGDYVALLVEDSGPGGMFTELGRTAVVGKVPQQMKDELEFTIAARKVTLDLLKPGTPCKEVWDTYNGFMRKNGRPEEARLYCHGQGYDLVERPLVRPDDPMKIEKNMNLTVHPGYYRDGYRGYVCDNFIVGDNGVERIHKFPLDLIEID